MSLEVPASIPVTLIPGDGIGPEVIGAVVEIFDALGRPFTCRAIQFCRSSLDVGGSGVT